MINSQLLSLAKSRLEELKIKELLDSGLLCKNEQFFPSVHYPPITMYPRISEENLFKTYTNPSDNLFSVYAHIPFCINKCVFCHYPVKLGESPEEKDHYLSMLNKEMLIYMSRLGLNKIRSRSILIGGGTPTCLSPKQLETFLKSFTFLVDTATCTQFSYDVDPTTIIGAQGSERLKVMRAFGVDRLTIGTQSFDDEILRIMNRPHTAKEAIESVHKAKEAGFKINIELIFGYPKQSLDIWHKTMQTAVALGAEEIQLYRLKVIPYGDFTGFITKENQTNTSQFIGLEETLLMKMFAHVILSQNGYSENLTRVFSKTPQDFSHYANDQCCNLFDQLGFGLTAFSSLRDRFVLNTQDFKEYYSLINSGKLPLNRGLVRDKETQTRWALILPLKNRSIYKNYYKKLTGVSLDEIFREKIADLKSFNLITENEKILKLTTRGRFFADEVCQQFHEPRYSPFQADSYSNGKLNPFNNLS